MEGVIYASDTGPDARLFRAAVSVYTAWCHEHSLAPMTAPLLAPLIPPRAQAGAREHGRPDPARRLPMAAAPQVRAVPDDVVYGSGSAVLPPVLTVAVNRSCLMAGAPGPGRPGLW